MLGKCSTTELRAHILVTLVIVLVAPEIEPRSSPMLGKHSTTKLYSQIP